MLVIVAEDDMVTPRYLSDQLAKCSGAEKVILKTGGHFVSVLVDNTTPTSISSNDTPSSEPLPMNDQPTREQCAPLHDLRDARNRMPTAERRYAERGAETRDP